MQGRSLPLRAGEALGIGTQWCHPFQSPRSQADSGGDCNLSTAMTSAQLCEPCSHTHPEKAAGTAPLACPHRDLNPGGGCRRGQAQGKRSWHTDWPTWSTPCAGLLQGCSAQRTRDGMYRTVVTHSPGPTVTQSHSIRDVQAWSPPPVAIHSPQALNTLPCSELKSGPQKICPCPTPRSYEYDVIEKQRLCKCE